MKYLFVFSLFIFAIPVFSNDCIIYVHDERILVKGDGCVIRQQKPLVIKNTIKNGEMENVQIITIDGNNLGDLTILDGDQKGAKN